MTSFVQQCLLCAHYRGDNACAAFPGGIAPEVFGGFKPHRDALPGDHGVRFTEKGADLAKGGPLVFLKAQARGTRDRVPPLRDG